jgi:hypothetical protein
LSAVFHKVLRGIVVSFFLVGLLEFSGCGEKPAKTSKAVGCAANLRMIDQTKQNWAQANGKGSNDVATLDDLAPLFFRNKPPICPEGGTYTPGKVGEPAQCSIAEHNDYYKQHPTPSE